MADDLYSGITNLIDIYKLRKLGPLFIAAGDMTSEGALKFAQDHDLNMPQMMGIDRMATKFKENQLVGKSDVEQEMTQTGDKQNVIYDLINKTKQILGTKEIPKMERFEGINSEGGKEAMGFNPYSNTAAQTLGTTGSPVKTALSPQETAEASLRALIDKESNPDLQAAMLANKKKEQDTLLPGKVSVAMAGAPKQAVVQNAFEKEFGKLDAKRFSDLRTIAQESAQTLPNINTAINLLDSGVITGAGAEYLTSAGKALQRIGVSYFDDAISNTEAYMASQVKEVGSLIRLFGSGTGLSDADREYAEKAAAGKITMSEQSLRKILDINKRAKLNSIKFYNELAKNVDKSMSPFPLEVDANMNKSYDPDVNNFLKKFGI